MTSDRNQAQTLAQFDLSRDTIIYSEGTEETIDQLNKRKEMYNYIQGLQDALEGLKDLYRNPGCLIESDYKKAVRRIQDEFEFFEWNLLSEFDRKYEV